jgi:hypothetical protein
VENGRRARSSASTAYAKNRSGRSAVTAGSSWRSPPAAALRGFAKVAWPAAARRAFISAKPARGMYTSPRTSNRAGWGGSAFSRSGISRIVRTLRVTSSPMVPFPRVAPFTSTPST